MLLKTILTTLLLCAVASAQATRPVPGRMELGANIDENRGYTVSGAWVDAAHGFSNWYNGRTNAAGYPLDNGAQCNSLMLGQPSGVYKCTWTGTATLVPKSLGSGQVTFKITGTTTQPVAGGTQTVTAADLTITAPDNQIFWTVSGLDPANPFGNFHIWAPGYAGTGKTFRDEYTKWLTPFTTVRMIDWAAVNVDKQAVTDAYANKPGSNPATTQPVEWSSRVTPDQWNQTGTGGVAYEYHIALAVQTGAAWWCNIPYMASDDYVRQLAKLIDTTAPRSLPILVELTNEDWNSGFGQWLQNYHRANTPPDAMAWDGDISTGVLIHYPNGQYGTDGNTRAARCYADRARQVSMILRTQLGSHRFKMVLGGQAMWTFWLQAGLDWTQARYGDVDRVFDVIAIAPYWPINLPAVGTPIPTMAAQAQAFIAGDLQTAIRQHRDLANKYKLGLVCYEAGQNYYPWYGDPPFKPTDFPAAFQTDPLMGQCYDQALASAAGSGVTLYVHNSFIRPWTRSGMFALQQTMTEPPGVKWSALSRFAGSVAVPPATTQPVLYNGPLVTGSQTFQVIDGRIYQ